jgi:hypothetical protein
MWSVKWNATYRTVRIREAPERRGRTVRTWDEQVKCAFKPSPGTEYSNILLFAKDRKGLWFYRDIKRADGEPEFEDYPAHLVIPWISDRPKDWFQWLLAKTRAEWGSFMVGPIPRTFIRGRLVWRGKPIPTATDGTRWQDPRKPEKVKSQTVDANPWKHDRRKDREAGWPLIPFSWCRNYRLRQSARCPEEVPKGNEKDFALVQRFAHAESGLGLCEWKAIYDEAGEFTGEVELEADPIDQLRAFWTPLPEAVSSFVHPDARIYWGERMQRAKEADLDSIRLLHLGHYLEAVITDQRERTLLELMRAGFSDAQIAKMLNCSPKSIQRMRKALDGRLRGQGGKNAQDN